VVMDSIKAQMGGKELPVVGLPNAAVEYWVNQYIAPPDTTQYTDSAGVVDAVKYRTAQDNEVHLLAQQYGVDEKTIRDRINIRLQAPEEQGSDQSSMNHAFDLASKVDDPKTYPKFMQVVTGDDGKLHWQALKDPTTGQTLGPDDWHRLDLQIQVMQSQRKPGQPESEAERDLKAAQMYGQVYRLAGLQNDPQAFVDYQRWLGSYSGMTDQQYQDVQAGAVKRYRDLDPSDVIEANRRDAIIQQARMTPNLRNHSISYSAWQALPKDEQQRFTKLEATAYKYGHAAVKDWQAVIKFNDVTRQPDSGADDLISGTDPGATNGGTT
jgi:hypothetical protein